MTGCHFKGNGFSNSLVGCLPFIMQCTCLYMQNTSPSTEDSYIRTAGNYGFVLSLYFCKSLLCHRINWSLQDWYQKESKKSNKSPWLEPSQWRQNGRPKKGQKRCADCKNQRREIPAKPNRTGYPPVEAHVELLHISGISCSTGFTCGNHLPLVPTK